MRISDWSSDVCSSDLIDANRVAENVFQGIFACHAAGCSADHDGEFDLPVELLSDVCAMDDRLSRSDHGRRRLGEYDRLLRKIRGGVQRSEIGRASWRERG